MGKELINIPGLQPVVAPKDAPKKPELITEDELRKLNAIPGGPLRFFRSVIQIDEVFDVLTSIQAQLQFRANTGQNPRLVSLSDFRFAAVNLKSASTPAGYVDPGPSLVIQNKYDQERYTVVQAFPPPGIELSRFHYATAGAMIDLSREKEVV